MLGYATYGYGGGRGKQQQAQSSEEELGCGDDGAAIRVSQPQSPCPWQRTKWTDGMVRLLIWVVHSIGEDAATGDCGEQKGKKAAEAAGMQQKKGKWKTVSRAMMEKGLYVSPQQCEDKFNDLNKRYKRVNELVGKEAACVAVDNPAFLDSLVDCLPGKALEEARKLLSSKHLFFREMFAYHNTSPVSAAAAGGPSFPKDYSPFDIKGQNTRGGTEEKEDGHQHDHYDIVGDEEEEDYNDESDEKDEDGRGILDLAGKGQRAKRKSGMSPAALSPLSLSSPSGGSSTPVRQLKSEMMGIQGVQQQRLWLRMKGAELEEQRVVYQNRALQLERQRFKWLRFCGGKEREMERTRLRNERRRLENDRMLLLLQQKELTLVDPAAKVGEVDRRENF